MNETSPTSEVNQPEVELARERTNQVRIAGYTGGFSAFFACMVLGGEPTWPTAAGVAAVAAMVSVICHGILRREK